VLTTLPVIVIRTLQVIRQRRAIISLTKVRESCWRVRGKWKYFHAAQRTTGYCVDGDSRTKTHSQRLRLPSLGNRVATAGKLDKKIQKA
jgi:hypothetical protein